MTKQRFPFLISPYEGRHRIDRLEELLRQALARLQPAVETEKQLGGRETPLGAATEDFFSAFIPVLDGLDGIKRSIEEHGQEEWRRGMDIFYRKLLELLARHGLSPAAEEGVPFDPERHEAIGTEVCDGRPAGSIASVIQQGWIYCRRVLRCAKVTVSR